MQIFVKTLRRIIILDVELSDSIKMVKGKFQSKEGLHEQEQRRIYGGKELINHHTLYRYNVQKESTLHLLFRLCGGGGSYHQGLGMVRAFSKGGVTQRMHQPRMLQHRMFSSTAKKVTPQIYGIATYDALFKWVLSDCLVRPSFFHAFIPDSHVVSSERLDEHMNPIEDFQLLRNFLHRDDVLSAVKWLTCTSEAKVTAGGILRSDKSAEKATIFLHEMVARFDEIKQAFPKLKYDGRMDFVCKLDKGDYALVEMQVIPQNYWDRRALAYIAAFYGNQLRKGDEWKHIRKVIGLNILGGGKDGEAHWKEKKGSDGKQQFVRRYKFQEQLNKPTTFIDGIELIQYSIMNSPNPKDLQDQEKKDWVTFFKRGHHMSEKEVQGSIQTEAVLRAFELAKIRKLPSDVLWAYEAEEKEYDRYSHHTNELLVENASSIAVAIAVKLLKAGIPNKTIMEATSLTVEELNKLKD